MRVKNHVLIALGFVCIGLGTVGVVIPVLPTTPFILLAALCFSSSSERFHDWLQRSRVFGQYIENYRTKRGISIWLKVTSIVFLWTGLVISMIALRTAWGCVALGFIGICVTIHLILIKTRK